MNKKESLPTIKVPEFPGEIFDSFELNDMISYEIESPKEISLHINEVFGEDGQKEDPSTKMHLLKDGFANLSELLKYDKRLEYVETITAFSWIVTEHPKLLERFGFDIHSPDDYFRRLRHYYHKNRVGGLKAGKIFTKPGFASISREKFLELYDKENN
jgi:hypothetical protein